MMRAKQRKVMITGAEGMLGADLVPRLEKVKGLEIERATIDDLDITELARVRDRMLAVKPDIVIHCAAYTAVDEAEEEQHTAYLVNACGTKNIAFFCRELGAEMYYVSTDYVFNGDSDQHYLETDKVNPINAYGSTKQAGERFVQDLVERHKICRTSWLCGVHGPNFIETILKLAKRQKTIKVINDQVGRPTFTVDLAEQIAQLLDVEEYGIFHLTNSGYCTWYRFACQIIELAGVEGVSVRPITTEEFRSLAKRPKFSVLENKRFAELGLKSAPHWEDGLKRYLASRPGNET